MSAVNKQVTGRTTRHSRLYNLPEIKSCTIDLDGHKGHHIQIRQTYEEGVWSEWSDPVFVPADIGYTLEASYVPGKLDNTGSRSINLTWKPSTEEQGDMKYDISLTLLSCPDVTVHNQTKRNWFHSSISGASYSVTVTASNQAEKATTWSSVIEGDWTGKHFKSVNISENNLIMNWEVGRAEKTRYCIEWKSTTGEEVFFSNLTGNYERNQLNIPTGSFYPMQCYRISIHKLNQTQSTVGTAYYFKPLLTVGPGNLSVVNVTAHSVLLKWDAFDLCECQQLLKNWVIFLTDHKTNVSRGEISENSSVTHYLVQDLPLGFNYTFEVKGVTVYGEQTGSSFKSVSTPEKALNDNIWISARTGLIVLAVAAFVALHCFVAKRLSKRLCPDLPDPSNSNATTFVSRDNKYILSPKHLIDTSSEDKNDDPLMIETTGKTEANKVAVRKTEITDVVITQQLSDNDHAVTTEVETDFQFEYRKQLVPTTPGIEKETIIQFFGKLKDDFAHQVELPKEIDTLLIHNEDMISV
ncbi:interleukin-31 receptor subunit alpha-like [Pseudophryne corroboree]|uniref:interleukin-31 receptor subunit alpha-like n=1 Tax=Pseudophryne corroboree TaxID=495146 RepID=UPI00308135E1